MIVLFFEFILFVESMAVWLFWTGFDTLTPSFQSENHGVDKQFLSHQDWLDDFIPLTLLYLTFQNVLTTSFHSENDDVEKNIFLSRLNIFTIILSLAVW